MRPAVFLDRDGVINENLPDYVRSWEAFRWLPGALEALARLTRGGFPVVVVTNQSGIGRGVIEAATIDGMHARLRDSVAAAGGRVEAVMVCPHHPDDACDCRKPKPGMLRQAADELGIDLAASWMVGDHPTDAAAARAAGVRPILVRSGRGTAEELAADGAPVVADLGEAVDLILGQARECGAVDYFNLLAECVRGIDRAAVARLVDAVRRARDGGGMVYTLGNGGSAATASHLALDLAKNTRRPDRSHVRALCLADNAGLLTAWANDSHYEEVFAAQLDAVARPGDLVVAVSGSGNSKNVLRAIEVARAHGAATFGIAGFDGGKLAAAAEECVVVRSDNMQLVEDAHMAIVHAVMVALRDES
jgi:D-glycero-D-manno-heptose 1,7-bisphosphate phosphatase